MTKKDFAKTITAIRKDLHTVEFPKAMMTGQQEAKRTCTVNCNGRHQGLTSADMASTVLNDPRFTAMLDRNNAHAVIEDNPEGFKQIRVRW